MKKRISVTIDEKTDRLLNSSLKNSEFRNKSHLVEHSVKKFLSTMKKEQK